MADNYNELAAALTNEANGRSANLEAIRIQARDLTMAMEMFGVSFKEAEKNIMSAISAFHKTKAIGELDGWINELKADGFGEDWNDG